MIDIESKISNFRKIVWDREKKKSEDDLYNSTDINGNKLSNRKKDLENQYQNYVSKRKYIANIKKNEIISKTQEINKRNTLYTIQKCLDDLINSISDQLVKYSSTNEYKIKLVDSIKSEIIDNSILYLMEKDFDILDSLKLDSSVEVNKLDEKYIGGYIISNKEKSYRYNNTLLQNLNDKKYEIGKDLNRLLKEEVK